MTENVLSRIHEGMTVYDRDGEKVGKVKAVHGGAGEFTAEWNMAADDEAHASFQQERDLLPEDAISQGLRERLLQNGFVRVGATRQADCYVMPEQVAAVEEKRVNLNVSQEDVASF